MWSEPGRGTNFVLTLPRRLGENLVGASPVEVEPPGGALTLEDLGLTQPISLPSREVDS